MATTPEQVDSEKLAWQITSNGKILGSFTLEELERYAAQGGIKRSDQAWRKGMFQPLPCGSVPELAQLFSKPPRQVVIHVPNLLAKLGAFIGPSFVKLRLFVNRAPEFARAGEERLRDIAERRPEITSNAKTKVRSVTDRIPKSARIGAAAFLSITVGFWVWRSLIYVPAHDAFLTTFTTDVHGAAEEFAKVEKNGDAYVLKLRKPVGWSEGEPMHAMGKKEFAELFGGTWKAAHPIGLVNATGEAAVLKVDPGWNTPKFTCATGYFLMRPAGPLELARKVERALAMPSLAVASPVPSQTPEPSPTPSQKIPQIAADDPPPPPTAEEKSSLAPPKSKEISKSRVNGDAELTPEPRVVPTGQPVIAPATEPEPAHAAEAASLPEVAPEVKTALKTTDSPVEREDPKAEASPEMAVASPSKSTVKEAHSGEIERAATPEGGAARQRRSDPQLEKARDEAAAARARLEAVSAPTFKVEKAKYLRGGDNMLAVSRSLESKNDAAGALRSARQAASYFKQAEESLVGASSVGSGSGGKPLIRRQLTR